MYEDKRGWGHSAWEAVVDFASRCNVRHLFITHHDPDSDDDKLRELDKHLRHNFKKEFESIQLAREGKEMIL
jgi:ribonuclease BN (tRNA processing enzyme)